MKYSPRNLGSFQSPIPNQPGALFSLTPFITGARCPSRVPLVTFWAMVKQWSPTQPLQDGWDAKKLTEHMETYLQKKASDSESEARSGQMLLWLVWFPIEFENCCCCCCCSSLVLLIIVIVLSFLRFRFGVRFVLLLSIVPSSSLFVFSSFLGFLRLLSLFCW